MYTFFGKSVITKKLTTAAVQAEWTRSIRSSDTGCEEVPSTTALVAIQSGVWPSGLSESAKVK